MSLEQRARSRLLMAVPGAVRQTDSTTRQARDQSGPSAGWQSRRIGASPFVQMVLGAISVAVVNQALSMLVTRIVAVRLGPEEFGSYLLVRRAVAMALPCTTVAMGMAVPRYLAIAPDAKGRSSYLLGGALLGLSPGLLLLVLALWLPGPLAHLLFGSDGNPALLVGFLWLLIGASCHTLLYGLYRGTGRMSAANAWQLIGWGVGPVIVLYAAGAGADVGTYLAWFGLLGCLAAFPLAIHLWFAVKVGATWSSTGDALRKLLGYGLSRVPGSLAQLGLLALGPFLAARYVGMAEAGFLLAAQAVFQIADIAVSGFGVVVLPRVAQMQVQGKTQFLARRIGDLNAFILHIGAYLSLHLLVWSRPLMITWLGSRYEGTVVLTQVLLAGVIPYVGYVMLRSIIDGVELRPVNTANLLLALTVTAAASLIALRFGLGAAGLAWAVVLGLWLLLGLSAAFLWRRYDLRARDLMPARCAVINGILFLPSLAGAALLQQSLEGGALLAAGALLEAVLFFLYWGALWRMGATWAVELSKRVWIAS